jgi:DNA repair protein RadC
VDISLGSTAGTIADPKVILLRFDQEDKSWMLDILVTDHLIITSEGYFSFTDEGLK